MNWNEEHKRNLVGYEGEINQAYNSLIKEVAELTAKAKLAEELFSFAKQKLIKSKIDKAFKKYQSKVFEIITNGITKEWDFANTKNDALRQGVLDRLKSDLPAEKYNQLSAQRSPRNTEALEVFQNRKRGKFSISDRVWNLANNARTELEFAIDLGLSKGTSANEIARNIRKELNQPDKMFRKIRDKHGNLVASKAMKNYHSGKGVYKNANKNALRFSSNEINIAYKESDWLRMYQNKDVVGYKVFLSPQHTIYDMCDELKGNYPKDFKFNGWHVQCKCGVISILKSDEEFINELKAGEELDPNTSKNFVPDVPENFNTWVKENKERVSGWKSQPNFMRDNPTFIKKALPNSPKLLSVAECNKAIKNNIASEDIFKQNNAWSPERKKLHDQIIDDYFKGEKTSADKVFMLGGAGANGKSSVTESGKLPHPKGALVIDPDRVKGMIPEYNRLLDSGDKNLIAKAASFVHEESSYLGKEIRKKALSENWGTILDGVNDNSAEKIHENAKLVRELSGKKVRADYVSLDTDLSLKLAEIRAKKTGREVPKEVLLNANRAISKEFPDIIKNKSFDELYLWDTNENGNPRLILTQLEGKLKIYDQTLYDRFLSKANYPN